MYRTGLTANAAILRPFGHAALLFCGILGPLIFLIVYFTFGEISPDFDMLRQPIGRLELMEYGWIQSINFIVLGLFTCAFAAGLRMELKGGFGVLLLPLLYALTGLGTILLGIFIHEPIHTYATFVTIVPMIASFLLFSRRFAADPRWRDWAAATSLSAVAMVILCFLYWFANSIDSPFSGIFEHLVVFIRLVWLVAFILKLFSGTRLAPER